LFSKLRSGIKRLEAACDPGNSAMIALDAGKSLRLRPSDAARIGCLAGVLWITREGNPHDFFLTHGEFFELDRGLTIATALEPTLVSVEQLRLHAWFREILRRLRVSVGRETGVEEGIGI